ncbi:hypothetical protein OIO90_002544 [Microbotryomycetes sp. JL221]|nr:hypothetical protein OIO90_002544 [Microbotryomycetes sp. JL221]
MTSLRPLSVSSPRSLTSPKPSHGSSSSTHSTSPRVGSTSQQQRSPNLSGLPSTSPKLGTGVKSTTDSIGLGLGVAVDEDAKVEVTSPLELTQFVDNLLNDLEARFDAVSNDVLSRLNSLSTRVDSLEASIGELMSGSSGPSSSTKP